MFHPPTAGRVDRHSKFKTPQQVEMERLEAMKQEAAAKKKKLDDHAVDVDPAHTFEAIGKRGTIAHACKTAEFMDTSTARTGKIMDEGVFNLMVSSATRNDL